MFDKKVDLLMHDTRDAFICVMCVVRHKYCYINLVKIQVKLGSIEIYNRIKEVFLVKFKQPSNVNIIFALFQHLKLINTLFKMGEYYISANV